MKRIKEICLNLAQVFKHLFYAFSIFVLLLLYVVAITTLFVKTAVVDTWIELTRRHE